METPIEGSNPSSSVVFSCSRYLLSLTPIAPFHFAIFVNDLEEAREFYGRILGCKEGRSAATWVDFDFFGNQISVHNTGPVAPTVDAGLVEDKKVPMPHFGAVLDWTEFQEIAQRVRTSGIAFIVEPTVRFAGQPGEQMTMFFRDPGGNALEFKSFRATGEMFARAAPERG